MIRWALSELCLVNLDQTETLSLCVVLEVVQALLPLPHTPTACFTGGHLPAREILAHFHLLFPIALALAQRIHLVAFFFGPLACKPTCLPLLIPRNTVRWLPIRDGLLS